MIDSLVGFRCAWSHRRVLTNLTQKDGVSKLSVSSTRKENARPRKTEEEKNVLLIDIESTQPDSQPVVQRSRKQQHERTCTLPSYLPLHRDPLFSPPCPSPPSHHMKRRSTLCPPINQIEGTLHINLAQNIHTLPYTRKCTSTRILYV